MRQQDYKMVQGVNQVVQMSPQVAASYGSSVARLGQTLAQTGQDITRLMEETKAADRETKLLQADNYYAKESAKFNAYMLENKSTPEKWQDEQNKMFERVSAWNSTLSTDRDTQRALQQKYTQWTGGVERSVVFGSMKQSFNNRLKTGMERVDALASEGSFEEAFAVLAENKKYIDDEALYNRQLRTLKQSQKDYEIDTAISLEPFGAYEKINKNHWNLTPIQKSKALQAARTEMTKARMNETDSIKDAIITGKFKNESELYSEMDDANLTARGKRDMSKFYRVIQDENYREKYRSPKAQAILLGQLEADISNYQWNGLPKDEVYASIMVNMDLLHDSRYKEELQKKLDARRQGAVSEREDLKSSSIRRLTRGHDDRMALRPEPPAVEKKLIDFYVDGWFTEENMKRFFDEKTAKQIASAGVEVDVAGKFFDPEVKDYKEQMKVFKANWERRERDSDDIFHQDMALATLSGGLRTTVRKHVDTEAYQKWSAYREESHQILGSQIEELNQFFKDKPDAKREDVEQFLIDQGVQAETMRENTLIEPRPKTSTSSINTNLMNMVKQVEGFSGTAYDDYKQKSIGYGTKARRGQKTITEEEAEQELANELEMHQNRVLKHISKHDQYKNFEQHQIDALTSFDYNTGSLEKLTQNGTRTPNEIAKMMLEYNKAGGQVLGGLVNRREQERNLFLYGYNG